MSDELVQVRRMWHLLEPLHAVFYYAPEVFEEAADLGYATDERWPSYFAWRAAPLGAVGADRVTEVFHSFSPATVAEHIPAGWDVAAPGAVLDARVRAVDRAYRALFGDRDKLKNDYLSRATGAQIGLFAFGGMNAPKSPLKPR